MLRVVTIETTEDLQIRLYISHTSAGAALGVKLEKQICHTSSWIAMFYTHQLVNGLRLGQQR